MSAIARRGRWIGVLLFVASFPAMAQDTVEGSLQLDGETVALNHVYAREGVPGVGSDRPGHVIVLMTDRPAPPDVVASRQAYYAAAREGRLRGALLVLEPEPRFVLFAPGSSYVDTRVPDFAERLALTGLERENGWVSGQLTMSEPAELDPGDVGAPASYRIEARFSAAIAPPPQVRETLTGAAARNSPQAAAALQALRIIHTGSATEVRAALHPDHPVWEMLGGDEAEAILQLAREMLPAPDTFLASIQSIAVYEERALITARDDEGDTNVTLSRDGGEWKLARAPISND